MATEANNWVDFELGEDVRTEARLLQDQSWKEAVADGRAHISHREANQVHAVEFCEAISQFQSVQCLINEMDSSASMFSKLSHELLESIIQYSLSQQHSKIFRSSIRLSSMSSHLSSAKHEGELKGSDAEGGFRVCLRKRPLSMHEQRDRAYDCIECYPSRSFITAHDGKKSRTGKRIHMDHKHFFFDRVWDDKASNEEVCSSEISRLISWAKSGLKSTLLCFGQTGTGKTYTLNAALEYVVASLSSQRIEVTFFEIHGKKCYDLLADRTVIHLRSDDADNVHVRGARTVITDATEESARQLLQLLHHALSLRSCEVTERNPISSRSHAICSIQLFDHHNNHPSPSSPSSPASSPLEVPLVKAGKIMLVDLAGSERNVDTIQMTREQHRESAEINSALMALKDCFRLYQMQQQQQQQQSAAVYAAPASGSGSGTSAGSSLTGSASSQTQTPAINGLYGSTTTSLASGGVGNNPPAAAPLPGLKIRPPYRASLLTRVLKECFSQDRLHRTLIVTTVSPSSIDLMHSVNSIQHVLHMVPSLSALAAVDTIELYIRGAAGRSVSVEDWTAENLSSWLAYTEGGRFSQLVLPPGMNGRQLMSLNTLALSALFEGQLRAARRDEEGVAWVEEGVQNRGTNAVGSLLWRALRREDQGIAQYRAQMQVAALHNHTRQQDSHL